MVFDVRARVFGAYVIVLTLGALLATLVLLFGGQVHTALRAFTESDLPELRAIESLKLDLAGYEALLLEYNTSHDRAHFLEQRSHIEGASGRGIGALADPLESRASLGRVRALYTSLQDAGVELDQALQAPRPDAARARRVLARAGEARRALNDELETLASAIEARAARSAAGTAAAADRMRWRVLMLAAGIFAVSLFVGYYVNTYVRGQAERRRLGLFPQRSPNPVLQLDSDGTVRYANPAANALLAQLGLAARGTRALLPEDLEHRLEQLRGAERPHETWEYRVRERTLECNVHWVPDLRVFHAYLSDITERKRVEERIVHQAYHDILTGLPNRRMYQERIEAILYSPDRGGMRAAVLLMGLDRFKVIVDSLGHAIGDGLIKAVAARLLETLEQAREMCGATAMYRFEGDRFCVVVPGFRTAEIPVLLAERVAEAMHRPFYVSGRELHASLSIGVSVFPLDGQDGATLLKNADTAMHRAKRLGGNGLQCYTRDMNDRAAEWLALENHLRHAEEYSELKLLYQPQVDIASGRVTGAEALVRWEHPERGTLMPELFVPLAEETGLIVPIGAWTLRAACRQAKTWLDTGLAPVTVAVNISAHQFHQQDLPQLVAEALRDTGLPPPLLELEITESAAMGDVERAIAVLHALKDLGVRLSLDDFGTGFSSLSYLKRFPLDKLKVDQSFVRQLASDASDAAIVQAIVALGHSLKLRVIAEGVESAQQLALLRAWKCDEYQGRLFSAPLDAEQFAQRLQTPLPA